MCGSDSVVECHLAKVEVAGPNPVSRSKRRRRAQKAPSFFCARLRILIYAPSLKCKQVVFIILPSPFGTAHRKVRAEKTRRKSACCFECVFQRS